MHRARKPSELFVCLFVCLLPTSHQLLEPSVADIVLGSYSNLSEGVWFCSYHSS